MRSDETLKETLEKTGLPVKYYQYKGTSEEYIVYNEEDERCTNHADDQPGAVSLWWQVHLFAPETYDFRKEKRKIRNLLIKAGFGVRDAKTIYEEETRIVHVVISCNAVEEMEE